MNAWWQDLRIGARSLRRAPALTSLALVILAVGIGGNVAIFSVVEAVLLAPLPLAAPDRLVIVADSAPKLGLLELASSAPNFADWREQNRVFASLAAMRVTRFTISGAGLEPEVVPGLAVTGEFFRTLGIRPLAGRLLGPQDDRPGGEPVAVLGTGVWHRQFGGDPRVVNHRIAIDGRAYRVVGVAPRTFEYPREPEIWVPLALDLAREDRGARYLHVLGRLRPGVTLEHAQAEMSVLAGRLARQYPAENADFGVVVSRLSDLLVRNVRPALTLLELAVWVVLLIAAADVASLLLARASGRQRELAVRAAVGAGPLRLVRLVVAESLVLAAGGGALGLLLGAWGARLLIALDPEALPRAGAIGIDGRVVVYALLVAIVCGIACGLVAATAAIGGHARELLRESVRSRSGSERSRAAGSVLVLGQVALALALLIGAALLMQSFARLRAIHPGFTARGVVTAHVSLPRVRYPNPGRQAAFYRQALARVRALPGVQDAGTIYPLPLVEASLLFDFAVAGQDPRLTGGSHAHGHFITPGLLGAMQVPLLRGRAFTEGDESRPVVIVSRALAARTWPGEDPLGRRITFGNPADPEARWLQVVGIAGDVRDEELAREPEMQVYLPQFQAPVGAATFVVRTAADPRPTIASLRQMVRRLDPALPLDRVQSLDEIISWSLAEERVKTLLLGVFAAMALVLAAVGIYGLVSNAVGRRVHEIGIRVALGATRGEVARMMIREGMAPVAAGLLVGLAGGLAAGRLLAAHLFAVRAADPWTCLGAMLLLGAIALLANWLPARRAARIDPLVALRHD
jgi:putative ABC transport system permease protein